MIPAFELPPWLPWWVPTVVLVLGLLWLLAFLLVPFSVIGVKARLEGLEARLDEIQAEIRTLAIRLPEGVQAVDFDELYTPPPPSSTPEPVPDSIRRAAASLSRPPIPPAPHEMEQDIAMPPEPPPPTSPPQRIRRAEALRNTQRDGRAEPRLDWPR